MTVGRAQTRAGDSAAQGSSAAAPNTAVVGLEQQLALLFATARTLMRDRAAAVHPELSIGSYNVLSALVRTGPQHASTLATTLFADKSVISRIIRQLTDLGLAERRADPADGRAFFIAATPDAVVKVDAIRDDYRKALHRFLAGWDPSEIRQLTTLLGKLNGIEA